MDGKINLHPTFSRNSELLCVEYPGVVTNANKMLSTLGGIKHVEQVYKDPSKRLDLRFRPSDPCCKPLCGDRLPCTSLLLRVCKYERKKKNDDEKPEYMYRQNICGVVHSIYKFSSLCDYQYLAVRKDHETGKIHSMCPHLTIDKSLWKNESFFTHKVPLFLPPPIYGRLDTPTNYHYRKDHTNYRKKTSRQKTNWEDRVSSRKNRQHHCILVKYDDKTPEKCLPEAFEQLNSSQKELKAVAERVRQAFEERPAWSRNALQAKVGLPSDSLKVIVPVYAYYMTSGPWARLWIKFGYDPKLDPSSRFYQLIDFRLRQGIYTPHIPIKAKRSTFNYKLPNLISKSRFADKPATMFILNANQSATSKQSDKGPQDTMYIYQSGVLPAHRQIYYQACDIQLPIVQSIVSKCFSEEVTCTKEDGWLLPNTTSEIRNIITQDIHKTLNEMNQSESQEQSDVTLDRDKRAESSTKALDFNEPEGSDLEDQESDDSSDLFEDESATAGSQDDVLAEDTFSIDADDDDDGQDEEFNEEGLFFDEEVKDEGQTAQE